MYPSRFTEVTEVTAEIVAQALEFAGYQAGIAARMAVPRLTDTQRDQAATLVSDMMASLRDEEITSSARWAVFSFLSDHSGNRQHRTLIADVEVALARNLRGWVVPRGDRGRMTQIYVDFASAITSGDGDEAERLARAMYYV
jgi:DNA-binding FadR family transcriptional regulator